MICITAATEDDVPRILEIEHESISPPWTHGALLGEIYREDSFFAVGRFCEEHRGTVLLCSGNTREPSPCAPCVGFIILRRIADEGELFQIAVDKSARRGGVADMLMNAALDYASDNRLLSVYLEVRRSNDAAICLYKKHGFESVRQRKGYYNSPVEDAVVMMKLLKGMI